MQRSKDFVFCNCSISMSVNNNAIEWPMNALKVMMSAHLWGMMSFFLAVLGEEKSVCCWYLSVPRRWERISMAICVPVCVSMNWHNYQCVCPLCNSAVDVIKQVLYCGRFLTYKAFAVCYESGCLNPLTCVCMRRFCRSNKLNKQWTLLVCTSLVGEDCESWTTWGCCKTSNVKVANVQCIMSVSS